MHKVLIIALIFFLCQACSTVHMTHGPMLGRQSSDSMGVWCRTSTPTKVQVRYGIEGQPLDQLSEFVYSELERDNTARVFIKNLKPGTRYKYQLLIDGKAQGPSASFKTLPNGETVQNEHNPKGLFNFKFEFGCGNNTSSPRVNGILMPTYATMLKKGIHRDVDFAILNGDFIYEIDRDFNTEQWLQQTGEKTVPPKLQLSPDKTGVWQNYKTYLEGSEHLREWHTYVPSYYTMDDHEILNDVYGSGSPGRVDRKAVFRDPATQSWLDYIGWSNHTVDKSEVHISRAKLSKGSSILKDLSADFSKLDPENAATLHVQWGKGAGMAFTDGVPMDDPNAGVYEIVEVIDKNTIKVSPEFKADSDSVYSIGKGLFGRMTVSNCDIFILDSRTYREMHDTQKPDAPVSMIGKRQKAWLMNEMKKSKADFFFVVSSVNFMVPHVGSNAEGKGMVANKDDAWTVFLNEREQLIKFWETLDKPVFVLTGDLHNSIAVKITDKIWEFASAPHNSPNHILKFEGSRPVNGPFQYGPRGCFIRWSSAMLNDTPKPQRRTPVYCIVQVNNIFNNPKEAGKDRWVAYPVPQVIFQYYSGISGELLYSETVLAK